MTTRRRAKALAVESVADFKARLSLMILGSKVPMRNKAHPCVVRKGKPTYGYNKWEKAKQ
jgi:hypothetical protein